MANVIINKGLSAFNQDSFSLNQDKLSLTPPPKPYVKPQATYIQANILFDPIYIRDGRLPGALRPRDGRRQMRPQGVPLEGDTPSGGARRGERARWCPAACSQPAERVGYPHLPAGAGAGR